MKHLKISKTRAWTTQTRHKPSGRIGVWEGPVAQALINHLVIGSLGTHDILVELEGNLGGKGWGRRACSGTRLVTIYQ